MRYLWFWAFWHWSKESFREVASLRGPLPGIGSHWDQWFRHEATEEERSLIGQIGADESSQEAFIFWLRHHWVRDMDISGNRLTARFVLNQLSSMPPFDGWTSFSRYQGTFGSAGVHAIVLVEGSRGERTDVREIEAVTLPTDPEAMSAAVVPDGFQADELDLLLPRDAALSMFGGSGLWALLARWTAFGKRPYPRWIRLGLALGWAVVAALIARLVAGSDPGEQLYAWCLGLTALWLCLAAIAASVVGTQVFFAWRQGRKLAARLKQDQVRLRMLGGLTLKGGSAGLAYCLSILLSIYRSHPRLAQDSWLWRRFFRKLSSESGSWAATGVVTADAQVKPVALEAKLRACAQDPEIEHVLTPRQDGAEGAGTESTRLRVHRCGHVAQAFMWIGRFRDRWQIAANIFAVLVSATMLAAMPDLLAILMPPVAPAAVGPASPSPYYLWVSLSTKTPRYFDVVLESRFWTNRRVNLEEHKGAQGSVRAEIRLQRVGLPMTNNLEDGTIWIERRRRFLYRDFEPGDRVGQYSYAYIAHIDHE